MRVPLYFVTVPHDNHSHSTAVFPQNSQSWISFASFLNIFNSLLYMIQLRYSALLQVVFPVWQNEFWFFLGNILHFFYIFFPLLGFPFILDIYNAFQLNFITLVRSPLESLICNVVQLLASRYAKWFVKLYSIPWISWFIIHICK